MNGRQNRLEQQNAAFGLGRVVRTRLAAVFHCNFMTQLRRYFGESTAVQYLSYSAECGTELFRIALCPIFAKDSHIPIVHREGVLANKAVRVTHNHCPIKSAHAWALGRHSRRPSALSFSPPC
jgi:hypothetical protein